jgi:hypothetical protein
MITMNRNFNSQGADISLCEILKPLQNENNSFEYKSHYKAMEDFLKRLRQLEAIYAGIYEQMTSLEKKIGSTKENTPAK